MPTYCFSMCNINSGQLNFGNYNAVSELDSNISSGVVINCDTEQFLTININSGNAPDFNARHLLSSNEEQLNYNLYLDSGRTVIFGDGTNGSFNYSGTIKDKTVNVYGKIPKLQPIPPGSYSDSLELSIVF